MVGNNFSYEALVAVQDRPLPFKKGDWVESKPGIGQVRVAKVKDCYWSPLGGDFECVFDAYMFAYSGDKVGRLSAALGGPRHFEPALPASEWQRIEEPRFPIEIRPIPSGDGRVILDYATAAKVLPDREYVYVRKQVTRPTARPVIVNDNLNGFNLEAEVLSRKLAAEKLRDLAHTKMKSNPEAKASLIEEAEALEKEAAALTR